MSTTARGIGSPRLRIRCRSAAKRIYEPLSHGDGYRVLIDGIWPRGIARDRAAVDQWARELAPSPQLRRWYGHDPDRFEEFARRYRAEPARSVSPERIARRRSRTSVVTLVFAARDAEHSNATVLGDVLRRGLHGRPGRSRR